MTQALGGRVAEEIVFGDSTTGAANDLEKVSELAREMVTEFGMSAAMGPITYGRKHGPVFLGKDFAEERNYSEDAARQIDTEIRSLVDGCYTQSRQIIEGARDRLDLLAEALLERETLTQEEVHQIVEHGTLPPPAAVPVTQIPPPPGRNEKAPDKSAGRFGPSPYPGPLPQAP
jgi:cell division protease FtsH